MSSTGLIILLADAVLCAAIVVLLFRGGRTKSGVMPELVTAAPAPTIPATLPATPTPPAAIPSPESATAASSTARLSATLAGWRRESPHTLLSAGASSSSTMVSPPTGARPRPRPEPVATPISVPVFVDEPYVFAAEEHEGAVATLAPQQVTQAPQTSAPQPVRPREAVPGTLPRWIQSPTHDYSFAIGEHSQESGLRRRVLIAAGTGAILAITYAWLR